MPLPTHKFPASILTTSAVRVSFLFRRTSSPNQYIIVRRFHPIRDYYVTMPRGTKHLTEGDRQRVRTLYFDAKLSPAEIERITGFTLGQIKRSRESVHVGKRTGRPKLTSPVDDGKEATRVKFQTGEILRLLLKCSSLRNYMSPYLLLILGSIAGLVTLCRGQT